MLATRNGRPGKAVIAFVDAASPSAFGAEGRRAPETLEVAPTNAPAVPGADCWENLRAHRPPAFPASWFGVFADDADGGIAIWRSAEPNNMG